MSPLAPNGNRPTECYAEPQPVNGETLLQRIDMGRRSNKITYSNDELRHIREPNGRRSPSLEHSVVYNDIARTNLLPAFASPAAQPNDLYNAYRNSVQDRLTRHQHQGGNMTHNRFNSSQQQRPRRFTRDRNANGKYIFFICIFVSLVFWLSHRNFVRLNVYFTSEQKKI